MSAAKTTKRFFSRETEVTTAIRASAESVWAILTAGRDYPSWNSTVVSIEGEVVAGGKIALRSSLDPKRTFKLRVKAFEPHRRLVWGDPMGTRTFTLEPNAEGVDFRMHEKIGGPIFPLFAHLIPSFDESFDRFAADLKRRAERAS